MANSLLSIKYEPEQVVGAGPYTAVGRVRGKEGIPTEPGVLKKVVVVALGGMRNDNRLLDAAGAVHKQGTQNDR